MYKIDDGNYLDKTYQSTQHKLTHAFMGGIERIDDNKAPAGQRNKKNIQGAYKASLRLKKNYILLIELIS